MKKWYTLIIICLTQIFVSCDNAITLNSLSSLVKTFSASTSSVQLANSIYPLVTGALMLAGGFLGLKIGWKKLLYLGLFILTCAETLAFLSPNIIFFTWIARLCAGLGASLAIPAAIGLIPATYKGKDMAIGFGAIGAATGIAAIISPIGGGLVIVDLGWRIAFAALAICFAVIFILSLKIKEVDPMTIQTKFDFSGTILFAISMFLIIISVINIVNWKTVLSLSLLGAGLALLIIFILFELKLEKKRDVVLLPSVFIKQKAPRAGLLMTLLIFFITGGISFAMTNYLQIILGLNAFKSGLISLIVAIPLILCSIGTPMIIKNPNPRKLCQLGILFAFGASLIIAVTMRPASASIFFYICLFFLGAANGILSSQAGVIVTSFIPKTLATQSGGIQGSMRNIGQVVGVSLIGIIMISSLTSFIKSSASKTTQLPPDVVSQINLIKTASYVNSFQLQEYLSSKNLPQDQQNTIISGNTAASIKSFKVAFGGYALLIALFFLVTFQIPKSYLPAASIPPVASSSTSTPPPPAPPIQSTPPAPLTPTSNSV